jgi:uncharacterized protein (DUF924 family)
MVFCINKNEGVAMPDRIHELLEAWFGKPGSADLPNSDRTNLWFGESGGAKEKLVEMFQTEYDAATAGKLADWSLTPRGRLALLILLDQFSRYNNRFNAGAFSHDTEALHLCEEGLEKKMDQALTLIERVFFYMPMVHAENPAAQEKSIRLFQELVNLSMPETTQIYQLFLAYAYAHYRVIKEFGRFPQRNQVLGRQSTEAELAFLKNT